MYARKTRKRGPVPTSKAGRICKKPGCRQRLSVYNPELFCRVHFRESLR